MSNRFLLCRFTHQAGRLAGKSRDWAIAVIGQTLEVRTGNTGAALSRRPVLQSTWTVASPEDEAERRLTSQVQQGYEVVGHCSFTPEGLTCDVSPIVGGIVARVPVNAIVEEQREAIPPALFWGVRADRWDTAKSVMDEVARVNQDASPQLDLRWTGRNGLPTNIPVIDGYVIAFPGLNGSGTVRWDGEVPVGTSASVLLWILLFRKIGAGRSVVVSLADANGTEITGLRHAELLGVVRQLGGADMESLKPVALSLGIISAGLDGLAAGRMKRFKFS